MPFDLPLDLARLPLPVNLLIFGLCAAVVWFAGARLTYLIDTLSDRFSLAKSLAGLLILSLATSLPEVATTLSASIQQNRDLVLNNLFGGIALQTAILATADFWVHGAITNYPRKANHALEATLLVMLLSVTLVVTELGEPLVWHHIGIGSLVVGAAYAGAVWLLRWYDAESDWVPVDLPDAGTEVLPVPVRQIATATNQALLAQSGLACVAILIFGVILVLSAEVLAVQSGLGSGFIGVTLLAGATSLPELTTSITAVRLGAYTMAISNIFGSNLIMLVLVLPADLLFVSGPILSQTSLTVSLSLGFGIIVTSIYLVGLIIRRKPRLGTVGVDSVIVLIVFALSLVAYFYAR